MTTVDIAEGRRLLAAWAGCVRRLMAVAPTRTVMDETGVSGGHSTPDERKAIRRAAEQVVDGWLARDLEALLAGTPDLDVERLARALDPVAFERPGDASAAFYRDTVLRRAEAKSRAKQVAAEYDRLGQDSGDRRRLEEAADRYEGTDWGTFREAPDGR